MKKMFLMTLSLMLFAFSGWSQKTVTGVITDESGLPLPGASVIEKGTSNGVITDFDGNYSIEAVEGAILSISFIGYQDVDVTVLGDVLNISLEPGVALEEVIVTTGYSSIRGKSFTGSAKIVSSENISSKNVTNITQALAGEVAGVQVVNSSGQPGTTSTISIRGTGSVNGNTSPLIVLDGVPFSGSLNSINPQDIESTVALKDASATAIYGSRGANGVIVINTRKGSSQKSRMSIQVRSGSNMDLLPRYDYIQSPEEYIGYIWEGQYNKAVLGGSTDPIADANANLYGNNGIDPNYNIWNENGASLIDPVTRKTLPGVTRRYNPENWSDYAFQDAQRQEVNLNISGGSDTTTYYTSLGFVDDVGYSINSDFKRYSARLNLSNRPKEWLSTNTRLGYSYQETNNGGQSSDSGSVFWVTTNVPSIYPLFMRDSDGNKIDDPYYGGYRYDYADEGQARGFAPLTNAIGDANLGIRETIGHNFNGNFEINLDLAEGLTLENRFGLQYTLNNRDYVNEPFYSSSKGQGGYVFKSKDQYFNFTLFNGLKYIKDLDESNLEILVAHESTRWERNYMSSSMYKLVEPMGREFSNAVISNPPSSYTQDYALESYLGRIAYSISNKYFVDFTMRRDGTSRFVNNKWGTFGSVGLSWAISDEAFFQNQNIFSSMKVRTSYGVLGEQRVGYYTGYNLFNVSNLNNNISLAFASKGNPDLTWEKSNQFGIGLDFSVGSFAQASIDYFNKDVEDLLFSRRVGPSVGYASIQVNDGALVNKGIELDVNFHVIDTDDFKLDIRVLAASIQNELTQMPLDPATGEEKLLNVNGYFAQAKGRSLYDFYIRESAGVNPDNGAAMWSVSYVDADNNGAFDSGEEILSLYDHKIQNPDDVILTSTTEVYTEATKKFNDKSSYPDLAGSFSLNAEYKGFDFTALFLYSLGGYGYDSAYANLMRNVRQNADYNLHTDISGRWQQPGDVTDVPRLDLNTQINQGSTSTRFLTSSDYLSLSSLRVGYSINDSALEEIGVSSLRLFFTGDNLMMLSKRKGYNPTTAASGNTSWYNYNPLSTVTFGANINF
ncbi:SusC/RagA family TonB-linked outer membrane protein [Flavobacteriaceae bacterium]|nr:SusC/RagA family TonB-linked outer membrane protein [Flavobacteriaceae bacterium]